MDLRLLLLEECNRRCKGCCNKDWDLPNLPKVETFSGYKTIMLTGGEPMLVPERIKYTTAGIRCQNPTAKVVVYTAKTDDSDALIDVLRHVDGLTVTLHVQKDVGHFRAFDAARKRAGLTNKSLRLNVFANVELGTVPEGWDVKQGIKWIKDCPLPTNEEFRRL